MMVGCQTLRRCHWFFNNSILHYRLFKTSLIFWTICILVIQKWWLVHIISHFPSCISCKTNVIIKVDTFHIKIYLLIFNGGSLWPQFETCLFINLIIFNIYDMSVLIRLTWFPTTQWFNKTSLCLYGHSFLSMILCLLILILTKKHTIQQLLLLHIYSKHPIILWPLFLYLILNIFDLFWHLLGIVFWFCLIFLISEFVFVSVIVCWSISFQVRIATLVCGEVSWCVFGALTKDLGAHYSCYRF